MFISPVLAFTTKPAGAEKTPPVIKPVFKTGSRLVVLLQTGLVYVNPVIGVVVAVIVMFAVPLPAVWQPFAGTE